MTRITEQRLSGPASLERFDRLYTDNFKRIYRVAYRITDSHQDAEELTEDAFLILLEKLLCDEVIDNPNGFLLAVIRNLLGNHLQKKATVKAKAAPAIKDTFVPPVDFHVSMEVLLPKQLTREEKEILLLRIDDKLPYKAIAPLLNISEEAARVRFMRARLACQGYMHQGPQKGGR